MTSELTTYKESCLRSVALVLAEVEDGGLRYGIVNLAWATYSYGKIRSCMEGLRHKRNAV